MLGQEARERGLGVSKTMDEVEGDRSSQIIGVGPMIDQTREVEAVEVGVVLGTHTT